MKQLHFHADMATVVMYVNGQPLAVNGEVDITVKQPSKLHPTDNAVWAQATKDTVSAVTVSRLPGA